MVIPLLLRSSQLIGFGLLLLCGCATRTATELRAPENIAGAPPANTQPLANAHPLGNELPDSIELTEPTGHLALKDILALVLTRNNELSAYAWDVRAADARIIQASVVPNPTLSLEIEDAFGTGQFNGTKQSQTTLGISELIELGEKRKAREEVASRGKDVSAIEYQKARLKVLSEASDKFYEVITHQEEIRLVNEAAELARFNQQAIGRRVEAGKSSVVDEKRANIALARTKIAAEHAEHELASARKELASLWGSSVDSFGELRSDLFDVPILPAIETLETKLSANPEALYWINEEALRQAETNLARSRAVSDLTLGAGLRRLEGSADEAFVFQFSVPLQLFDRNQGGIAEAQANIEKSRKHGRALQVHLKALLFGIYQELKHKQLELRILSKEILPEAASAQRFAREGFEQGRFSHLELADAQKTFLESREAQIQAAVAYRHLIIELGRLTGETLPN